MIIMNTTMHTHTDISTVITQLNLC